MKLADPTANTRHFVIKMITASILCLLVAATGGCAKTPYPVPEDANTYYYGNIVIGSKFGARIGDSPDVARRAIYVEGGERYDGVDNHCDYYLKRLTDCDTYTSIEAFHVDKLTRRGNVYLLYRNNVLTKIVWDLYLSPYIDF